MYADSSSLSGVLINRKIMDANLYFDLFNPSPFWHKAKPVIEGMRKKRPHIYERFESINEERTIWARNRKNKKCQNLRQVIKSTSNRVLTI